AHSILDRHRARKLERQLTGVDSVVRAVDQRDDDVDDRVTGDDSRLQRCAHALLDRGDELTRDASLRDLVLEHETGATLARPHINLRVTELAFATGLADETTHTMGRLLDGFLVGDLWLALVGVHAKFAQQAVDDGLEVQLTHTRDDRLAGLVVGVNLESRVLLG